MLDTPIGLTKMNSKEDKNKGKIDHISIKRAKNGFTYCVYTNKGYSDEYVYQSRKDLLDAINDDITSPHIRKDKMSRVMDEYKKGELNIGKSDKKVKSRKQAIAIGLSYKDRLS